MGRPLSNRVALVTGGAGGIGSAICTALADAGANVVVGYHSSETRARELIADLPASGAQAHAALPAPVTDSDALAELAASIESRWGRCDILVNCAGVTRFVAHSDLHALDEATIDAILATNVKGPFLVARALHALLSNAGDGLIVNISSVAARTAMGSNIMYCASKAALDNMTQSLARALAPGIRVVSVAPGLVQTDFIANLDAAWRNEQVAHTPLGRLCDPADVGRAVTALALDFSFMTGAVLALDGGRPLR